MAKLYFRYGTVSSAKTLNLLAVAHNYKVQSKNIILIKPKLDDRFGVDLIKSRAGLSSKADLVLEVGDSVDAIVNLDIYQDVSCVLVDEAQFLTVGQIEQLRELATTKQVPVICYGLRTDFKTKLFPASKRLMELADSIEEVKTTCHYCNRKAILNLKHSNGRAICHGESIDLGTEDKYFSSCYTCFREKIAEAEGSINVIFEKE